jgi:hypothetical protein
MAIAIGAGQRIPHFPFRGAILGLQHLRSIRGAEK